MPEPDMWRFRVRTLMIAAALAALVTQVAHLASGAFPKGGVPASELPTVDEQARKRLLAAFLERAALTPPAQDFTRIGKPTEAIVGAAQEWPADMMVIDSHGRTGVGRVLLGSIAESVARHAPCAVLLVRALA